MTRRSVPKGGGSQAVALRVAVPERVRAVAIGCLVAGLFLLDESSAQGWLAWSAAGFFSIGAALYDSLGDGRVGARQVGMILLLLGMAACTWALLVILLTSVFLETSLAAILFVVLGVGLVMLISGLWLRGRAGSGMRWEWPRLVMARVRSQPLSERRSRAA